MNIEVHQPELEALIQQRMASGAFHDVEDALIQALKSSPPPERTDTLPSDGIDFGDPLPRDKSFIELSKSVRGSLTDEEVDTLFARNPSVIRSLDLS